VTSKSKNIVLSGVVCSWWIHTSRMPDTTLSSAPALLCTSWQVECEVRLTYEPV